MKKLRVFLLFLVVISLTVSVCAAGSGSQEHMSLGAVVAIVLVVAAIITTVMVLSKIKEHRPATSVGDADDYLKSDSFHLSVDHDRYLHTTTVRTPKPKPQDDD